MKRFIVKASAFGISCEFIVEAEDFGSAFAKADQEFEAIYKKSKGLPPDLSLMAWGNDRKLHIVEAKKGGAS